MSIEFVVPSERTHILRDAQSRYSGGNLDFPGRHCPCIRLNRKNLRLFFSEGQPMQHIGESFRMHQTMFDGNPEELVIGSTVQASVHSLTDIPVVQPDFLLTRPVTR